MSTESDIAEVDKALAFMKWKAEQETQNQEHYLETLDTLLGYRFILQKAQDKEPVEEVAKEQPEKGGGGYYSKIPPTHKAHLSECCGALTIKSKSKTVKLMGPLINGFWTNVCTTCGKPCK